MHICMIYVWYMYDICVYLHIPFRMILTPRGILDLPAIWKPGCRDRLARQAIPIEASRCCFFRQGSIIPKTGWWDDAYPSEKYERQLGGLFQIYGKITNVPNHQPEKDCRWRYVSTTFQARFSGVVPWKIGLKNRPYIRYLQLGSWNGHWSLETNWIGIEYGMRLSSLPSGKLT